MAEGSDAVESRLGTCRCSSLLTQSRQVWNRDTQAYVQTDKVFGKSLEADELALGFARFFCPPDSPLSRAEQRIIDITDSTSAKEPSVGSDTGSRADESSDLLRTHPAGPPALPTDLLLIVLRTLLRRLKQLIALLSTVEMRMRGGSLLVVVEGDPDALERAVLRLAGPQRAGAPAPQSQRGGAVVRQAESEQAAADDDGDDDGASVSTTDEEGNAKRETLLPLEMRLIDFAHTRAAPGEGPDEGVLLGLRTTERLWGELVAQLEERERQQERDDR